MPMKLVSKRESFMQFQENRTMLGIIVVLLLLIVAAVFFYNRTLNELAIGSCTDASADCPHQKVVETQNAVIAVLIVVIAIVAGWTAYQIYWKKPEPQIVHIHGGKAAQKAHDSREIDMSKLDTDEKKVFEILQAAKGSVFQSEIISKLGYSKVKISRILDKMEQKEIIERKRRGMSNLVVLR